MFGSCEYLWDAICGRGVARALAGDDAVYDGHADARQIAELNGFEDVFARCVLCLVHEDEIGAFATLDQACVKFAATARVAVGEAECGFGGDVAEG